MTQGAAAPAVLVADGDRPREGGPQRKEVAVASQPLPPDAMGGGGGGV